MGGGALKGHAVTFLVFCDDVMMLPFDRRPSRFFALSGFLLHFHWRNEDGSGGRKSKDRTAGEREQEREPASDKEKSRSRAPAFVHLYSAAAALYRVI